LRTEIENLKNIIEKMAATENDTSSHMDLSESDYPTLQTKISPEITTTEPTITYVQAAKKNNKNKQQKKNKSRYRSHNPTERDLIIAERVFQERAPEDVNKFEYIYVPINRRMRSSELRKKLVLLGIDNIQVLDVYCPDSTTVAILVHEKYVDTIKEKVSKAKIVLRSHYDHMDPIHIKDPKLQNLTTEQKLEQSKKIQNNNMMRALTGMRYTARYSVARSFFRDNLISLEQLKSILNENLNSNNNNNKSGFVVSSSPPPSPTNNNQHY
jgi:hypothetical protein